MASDINNTVSRRIRQARGMLGLSLRGLAAATEGVVSHNAIARYEKGEMSPGSRALTALSRALGQPLDYFVRPLEVELTRVRFRRRSKLSLKKQTALKDEALDFFERYWEVEEIMNAHRPFENPLDGGTGPIPKGASDRAKRLRRSWSLGTDPLPNVHELMELKGIKVYELPTENRDFDGFSAETCHGPVVVIAKWLNSDIPRKRMTEVHELAHIVLNIPEDMDEKDEEKLVWDFAGELFLPEESFTDAFGKRTRIGLSELLEFKAQFGASLMAIMYRARKLNLIRESAYQEFFRFANRHRWRSEGEPGNDVYWGLESYSRFRTLVHRGVIENKFTESKAAGFLHQSVGELRQDLDKRTFR